MNILPVILFLISFISLIERGGPASAMPWVEETARCMRRLAAPKDPDAEAQAGGALQATLQQHLGPIIAATLRGTRLLNGPYNEDNAFQNDAGVEVISLSITRLEAADATNNILLLTHEVLSIDDLFIRLRLGLTAHNVQVTVAAGVWVKNVTDPALLALVRAGRGEVPKCRILDISAEQLAGAAAQVASPKGADCSLEDDLVVARGEEFFLDSRTTLRSLVRTSCAGVPVDCVKVLRFRPRYSLSVPDREALSKLISFFPNLIEIELGLTEKEDGAVAALYGSALLPQLRKLRIEGCMPSDAQVLASLFPQMSSLEKLSLSDSWCLPVLALPLCDLSNLEYYK